MDEVEARLRVIEISRELTTTPEILQRMYDERLKKSGCDTNLLNLLSTWNEVPWLIEQLRLARANQRPEPVEGDEWVCLLKSVVMADHQVNKTLTARIEELHAVVRAAKAFDVWEDWEKDSGELYPQAYALHKALENVQL